MAATRTSRIELRADPERERRIRYAAELERQSVSAFVLGAACGTRRGGYCVGVGHGGAA